MLTSIIIFSTFSVIAGKKLNVSTNIEELIVGGQVTKIEEVPYQAALYFHDYYFCSGSIVTKSHIVTAAHCLMTLQMNPQGLTIRVGSSKMHLGGQVVDVNAIFLHPKFSTKTIDYDVAVAKLKTPLQFSTGIQPIKLGESEPQEGQEVKVSGWGFLREYGPPSRKLRSVLVNIVDRKLCAKNYKNRITVTNRMICASAQNKDACYGDSGGPLVCEGNLVGIVSTGEGCAKKDFPGIYTNVAHPEVKNFIKKKISD